MTLSIRKFCNVFLNVNKSASLQPTKQRQTTLAHGGQDMLRNNPQSPTTTYKQTTDFLFHKTNLIRLWALFHHQLRGRHSNAYAAVSQRLQHLCVPSKDRKE